jgi:hypothetical protein
MRIDDAIFREAKAEAAREGMTLTRFLEEALTFRVQFGRQEKASASLDLPVYDSGKRLPKSFNLATEIRASAIQDDQKAQAGILRMAIKAKRT